MWLQALASLPAASSWSVLYILLYLTFALEFFFFWFRLKEKFAKVYVFLSQQVNFPLLSQLGESPARFRKVTEAWLSGRDEKRYSQSV